ncbi:CRISPR-associated protein cas9/csn1, subtype II/nmemi [Enterococcus canis]|uniref:CRISPR-associated endonuclease Cas9 n=1 Tax=Enterococcus canis TaxID=214095 RepID=A0A1L8RGR8_9ENTE|nr:type II CRISPR RNA-guided endonuclease Cas9 [Enterococcus canis]OJG18991.1 CRISPR-associated protein cas9/csn1, subtype II/nmemi [Enterococcus canis]
MKQNKELVNIGFDIGIASVGWSVVSKQSGKILETGVSIFPSGTASKNEERRSFRQARRLLRRRKNRISDLKILLEENGFRIAKLNQLVTPYELRVRGLNEQLSKEELSVALLHLVKRRGISYSLEDSEGEGDNQTSYKQSVSINQKLLKEKTPGEIQLERLEKYGKIRGQVKDLQEENAAVLMNVFPNTAYVREAELILLKQKEYYSEITDNFIKEATALISRKREYFVGPGSEKSRTDYGIYRTDGTKLDNLFEILIGKDKIFPNEFRAAGNSYTAQLYNLLNDLNNLKIKTLEDGKLTKDQKLSIIEELKTTTKKVNMMQLIKKIAKAEESDISGYRIDRNDKPEIHSMAIFYKVRKKFLEQEIDINDWPIDFLDILGRVLTLNTENGEIRRSLTELKKDYIFLDETLIELIINSKDSFKLTSNQKWHRFSLKTMQLLIPELLNSSKEQMTILTELGLLHENKQDYSNKTKIDVKNLTENIYNPVVRKSVKQAMDIFNSLFKKYPNIAYLVVEMPRDEAEDEVEQKKQAQKFQKENEAEKEKSLKEFQELAGVSDSQLENQIYKRRKLRMKIRLWYQQLGKCPYSGKTIAAEDLFWTDHLFEIDHVIPLSISYDDGQNNKVLCYSEMNQEKGQKTPYGFMQSGKGQGFSALQAMLKSNSRMSGAKKRNLLFTEDINDIEVRKRFIARNLVDTRYASRIVLNELQQFTRSKQLDTKVTVIRGKFTSKLRETWRLNKSRETHHHHAVDATIIAVSPMLKLWERNAEIIPMKVNENVVDIKTGEILTDKVYQEEMYQLPYASLLEDIAVMENKIKFHHQVDKKMNRKVSDATIYATRSAKVGKDKEPQNYVLGKIKDIYDTKEYENFKKIYDKDKSKFLMQQLDPMTFEKLEKVLKEYPDFEEVQQDNGRVKRIPISPFELYRREKGPITKFAKRNNGPAIKSVKYYDSKMGSAIDITPQTAKNKKVVLQSLKPWRTDVYFNQETKEYEIMGIKYSDMQYLNGNYGITNERYKEIQREEGVADNSEFMMSLYRGDRIKVIDTNSDESVELLFGSRTIPTKKGYVELKPIEKTKFDSKEIVSFYGQVTPNGQFVKKFTRNGYRLLKVNTNILGNPYYISKEGINPRNILDTGFKG